MRLRPGWRRVPSYNEIVCWSKRDKSNVLPVASVSATTSGSQSPSSAPRSRILRMIYLESTKLTTKAHWTADLAVNTYIKALLLVITFSTCLMTAPALFDFHVSASVQTGNLTRTLNKLDGRDMIINSIISPASFLIGALVTGQSSHFFGPRKRAWQIATGLVQMILVFTAAGILNRFNGGGEEAWRTWPARTALVFLAFAVGSELCALRAFDVKEITIASVTGNLIDFCRDKGLWKRRNPSRNWRVAFYGVILVGWAVGASLRDKFGSAGVIGVAATIKGLASCSMIFAPADEEQTEK